MSSLQWTLRKGYFYWGNYKLWTSQKQLLMTFHFPLFLIRSRLLSLCCLKVNTMLKLSEQFLIIKGQYAFIYWETLHSNTTASRKLLHFRYGCKACSRRKTIRNTGTKLNTEMPALEIRVLTVKYSYVPELNNIFHLGKEEMTIFSYTEMCSSEIFLLPARPSKPV